ncbi:MAG: amino acid ABC transporter permease [Thermoprotei archaeon]|nr:MAG: amino acid ABC transporter permease [Thermoprotei archaeon]
MNPVFFIIEILPFLLQGLWMTIYVSFASFALGFLLAVLFAPLRIFAKEIADPPITAYVEVFRGTPVLVQLLFIYFGLPSLGIKLDPVLAGIVALGLNSAAYQSEIFRSALKAIPNEQVLAAESLGLSNIQIYRYVILPQALRVAVPSLINEIVALIKESSLVSIIGVAELTRRGEYLVAITFKPLEVFTAVALVYFIVCYTTSRLAKVVEKKFKIPGYRE